jgi:multidrug resistance efflux pump
MQGNYTQLCTDAGNLVSRMDRLELEKKHLTENYELELPYLQELLSDCREKLQSNVIRAPFDGVVAQLQPAVSGDKVSGQTPLVVLADTTGLDLEESFQLLLGIIQERLDIREGTYEE